MAEQVAEALRSVATEQTTALAQVIDVVSALAGQMAQMRIASEASEGGPSGSSGQSGRRTAYKPKEIPVFKGDPQELRAWQAKARQWLRRYPANSDQAGMLGDHLDGAPFQRYLHMCETAQEPVTAEQVFTMLEQHFADPLEASKALYEFQHLKQGSMTVLELSNRLDELAWTPGCEDLRTEFQLKERFLTALNPDIARQLTRDRLSFKTKEEAVLQAVLQERNLQASRRFEGREESGPEQTESQEQHMDDQEQEFQREVRVAVLQILQEIGVSEADLMALQTRGQRSHGTRSAGSRLVPGRDGKIEPDYQCWECQHWGHRKLACPGSKQ